MAAERAIAGARPPGAFEISRLPVAKRPPQPKVARAFLDANVLFSAAYREASGLKRLWKLPGAELFTSAYASEEARRNLQSDQRARLEDLLARTRIVPESDAPLPSGVRLPDKDIPILKAAIAAEATHLVTGDVKDFGRYLGQKIAGVLIVTPADFVRGSR
jgi:predicted nucleic acid-binding protein